ncbi:MAG: GAF domain-containing protein [Proteobacteria bacterium]|nr:GAF domain-containing protein [Pseudomonadota bacterium]
MARKPTSPSAYSFERLLARLSNELVAAPLASLDEVIVCAQNAIVHFLDLDRSTLFVFDETSAAQHFHLAARPGFEQVDIGPPHLEFPWVASQILAGKIVRFTRIDDLPPEAAVDCATFHRVGPRSNVTFPLIAGGQVFGALAFGVLREESGAGSPRWCVASPCSPRPSPTASTADGPMRRCAAARRACTRRSTRPRSACGRGTWGPTCTGVATSFVGCTVSQKRGHCALTISSRRSTSMIARRFVRPSTRAWVMPASFASCVQTGWFAGSRAVGA